MRKIRRLHGTVAAALFWLTAQPALADHNMFVIHGPPPMNWTGFHWGGHVGLQWSEVAGESLLDPTTTASFEERSWSAGLGFGYDREISTVVFGVTADVDLTRPEIESRILDVPIAGTDLTAESIVFTTELRWLSTVRGRIGYRMDRFLPFASAGVGIANVTRRVAAELRSLSDPTIQSTVSSEGSEWAAGWTAGGGLEYRLTPNDTIGLEYLYVDLPIDGASPELIGRAPAEDFTSHLVRMLFRYRF